MAQYETPRSPQGRGAMRARLYVLGVDRGEIEVGDNSMVGLLARGLFSEGMAKAAELQGDMDRLCGKPVPAPEQLDRDILGEEEA